MEGRQEEVEGKAGGSGGEGRREVEGEAGGKWRGKMEEEE